VLPGYLRNLLKYQLHFKLQALSGKQWQPAQSGFVDATSFFVSMSGDDCHSYGKPLYFKESFAYPTRVSSPARFVGSDLSPLLPEGMGNILPMSSMSTK
jgi:hypothetical protein